jgi:hypothetical protein
VLAGLAGATSACGTAVDPDGVAQQSSAQPASGDEREATAAATPATTTTVHLEVRSAPAPMPVLVQTPVVYNTPAYAPPAATYVHTSYTGADDGSTILYVRPPRIDPPPPIIYAPMRLPPPVVEIPVRPLPRPLPVVVIPVHPVTD